jgi:hypothetical protein
MEIMRILSEELEEPSDGDANLVGQFGDSEDEDIDGAFSSIEPLVVILRFGSDYDLISVMLLL